MRIYVGSREGGGANVACLEVTWDGSEPSVVSAKELDPRLKVRSHSPTGLEWGYEGSGPSQLALALVSDFLVKWRGAKVKELSNLAGPIYPIFKTRVVKRLHHEGWTLTEHEVGTAIADIDAALAAGRDLAAGAGGLP